MAQHRQTRVKVPTTEEKPSPRLVLTAIFPPDGAQTDRHEGHDQELMPSSFLKDSREIGSVFSPQTCT